MSDADLDNLDLLIDGFLNGELAEAQREELAARIERDPKAARAFDDALRTEALLHAAHVSSAAASSPKTFAAPKPSKIASTPRPVQRANFAPVRAWVAVAALVAVMFGAVLYYKYLPTGADKNVAGGAGGQKANTGYSVASGHVWVDGRETRFVRENEWLNVSEQGPVVLQRGNELGIELESGSGALLRKNGATLFNGAGTVNVRSSPAAFTLETSAGNVTTKQGEFSARLEPGAQTQISGETAMNARMLATLAVTVLAGSVQVETNGKLTQLALGESRVFGGESVRPRDDGTPPPRRPRPEFGVVGMMLSHARELDLSDGQTRKLEAIKAGMSAHKAAMDADQKLRDLHDQFMAALQTRDEAAVKAARIAVQTREQEIGADFPRPGNPQEVLTDSQRSLMREILELNRPPHNPGEDPAGRRDDGGDIGAPPPPPDDNDGPPPPRGDRPPPPRRPDGPPPARDGNGPPPPPDQQPLKGGGDANNLPPPAGQHPPRLDDAAVRFLMAHAEELQLTQAQKDKLTELQQKAPPARDKAFEGYGVQPKQ